MRILILNTLYSPDIVGGVEMQVQSLAEELARMGFAVTVVCAQFKQRISAHTLNGVRIVHLPYANVYWPYRKRSLAMNILKPVWHAIDMVNPRMHRLIFKIFREFKPHIVCSNNLTLLGITSLWSMRISGVPMIQTLHDYNFLCSNGNQMKKGKPCAARCSSCRVICWPKKIVSRCFHAVVGVSKFILHRHVLDDYFTKSNISVIPNTIDQRPKNTCASSRNGNLRLGYLGRIMHIKGIEALLEEIKTLEQPPLLLIAGTGEQNYIDGLKRRYSAQNITWLGWTPPSELFSRIDYLVVPSICNEAFGRVIVEAFAHGIPVLASRVGGIPELVSEGVTGYLFDPGRFSEMYSSKATLLNDENHRQKMSISAFKQSVNFYPRKVAMEYARLFLSLARDRISSRLDSPSLDKQLETA